MSDKQIVEGILSAWHEEGGFGPSEFEIDGEKLEHFIAEAVGIPINARGMIDREGVLARVRLTLEVLE